MPDPDSKVAVPTDEELREMAERINEDNSDTYRALQEVRDRTREATLQRKKGAPLQDAEIDEDCR